MREMQDRERVDFHIATGDLAHCDVQTFEATTDDQYLYGTLYRMGQAGIIRGAGFFPVLGNHDYNLDPGATAFHGVFTTPAATGAPFAPGQSSREFYSFNHGPLHMVAFNNAGAGKSCADVQSHATKDWTVGPAGESIQAQWLKADLARNLVTDPITGQAGRRWPIVYMHVPMADMAGNAGTCPTRDSTWIWNELRKDQVPVVFYGHVHHFEVLNACPQANLTACPPSSIPVVFVNVGSLAFGDGQTPSSFVKVDVDGDWMLVRGFDSQTGEVFSSNLGDGQLRRAIFALKRFPSSDESYWARRRIFVDPCDASCSGHCFWPAQLSQGANDGICVP